MRTAGPRDRACSGGLDALSLCPIAHFTVLTAAGSGVWNAVLIGAAGYALGADWDRVSGWIGSYSDVVLVVVVAAAILYPLIRHLRRRQED